MILTVCSTKMTSEHLLSANLTTHEYVFVLPNAKINPAKLTAFTVFAVKHTNISIDTGTRVNI